MDKILYYNALFLIYRDLLTSNEQEVFSLYYEENYSMGEISEVKKISRSAVGKYIRVVEQKLDNYEKILKINEKKNAFIKLISLNDIKEIKDGIQSILD